MLYSRNFFDADYGLSYIQADSIADLTRARQQSLVLTSMIRGAGGRPIENRGHSSVVERNGKYYIFYHKGSFDSNGNLRVEVPTCNNYILTIMVRSSRLMSRSLRIKLS
jgi:hypothetical protein